MKTRKMLFIANIFPPMGGSGVQRSAKFVRYLRRFDIEPVVLTREVEGGITDPTILAEIPKDIQVIRTKAYDYTQWQGVMNIPGKIIARKLLLPDGEVTWYKKSFKKAKEVILNEHIDVIYSTSYPYSDHLLGAMLKKEFPHLPWIVDFRDEWSMNPYILDKGYSKRRSEKEKKMEEMIAQECDYFIANTTIMHKNFLSMYPFLKSKSMVITNGFDEEDFADYRKEYLRNPKFVITHPGVLYGNRKIDKILKALQELENEGKIESSDIELRLIGDLKVQAILDTARQFNLEKIIHCTGYMNHDDTIRNLESSEVLLLLEREGKGAENIAPGKIYEYVNANRRILAMVPKQGVSADIIRATKTGIVCSNVDVPEIKEAVMAFYLEWKNHEFTIQPNWDEVYQFERKVLTEKLSNIVTQLLK